MNLGERVGPVVVRRALPLAQVSAHLCCHVHFVYRDAAGGQAVVRNGHVVVAVLAQNLIQFAQARVCCVLHPRNLSLSIASARRRSSSYGPCFTRSSGWSLSANSGGSHSRSPVCGFMASMLPPSDSTATTGGRTHWYQLVRGHQGPLPPGSVPLLAGECRRAPTSP